MPHAPCWPRGASGDSAAASSVGAGAGAGTGGSDSLNAFHAGPSMSPPIAFHALLSDAYGASSRSLAFRKVVPRATSCNARDTRCSTSSPPRCRG
eukprot:1140732-Prymnesium_polylepis.1